MQRQDRPLPRPRSGRFKAPEEFVQEDDTPLMADRIAGAAAEGRLEEFLKKELPDNEFAGKLVSLMMGMTGMAPSEGHVTDTGENRSSGARPPEDLLRSVAAGDMNEVTAILKREHEKRSPGQEQDESKKDNPSSEMSYAEKEVLDSLIKIASENAVTMDWIVLRALKLYIREYYQSGRL